MHKPKQPFKRCCLRVGHGGQHLFVKTAHPSEVGECQGLFRRCSSTFSKEVKSNA
jgi:hypothetical protein